MKNNIKNYKDDFDFLLKLYSAVVDKDGNEVKGSRRKLGWPDYDWSATMWTNSKANAYTASCTDGKCVNCYNDNGEIHIVVNDHHMGPGTVRLQFLAELPREIYPDGSQRNVIPEPVNIELIIGKGDLPTEMEVEMLLPYIKGDAFTYDDFTDEQLAELKKPATEAAGKLDGFVQTASGAESVREANEKRRTQMENKIGAAEQGRQTSEVARRTAENERIEAEADREKAETGRVSAEAKRAAEFATWETEIDSKADRSELSNVLAESSDDGAILKERDTGEVMYPQTLASLVKTSDGGNVDEGLASASLKGFDESWVAAGGTVTKSGEIYECNGTDDLSYDEAVNIYGWYTKAFTADCSYRFISYPYRAMLSIPATVEKEITADRMFYLAKNIEVVKFVNTNSSTMPPRVNLTSAIAAFMHCDVMREIATPIQFMTSPDSAFSHTAALEEVRIYKIAYNISFVNSPLLSLASLQYLVTNAANTSTITITVHPDVYAKLTGDTTNAAAAALTTEELAQWQQIITDGAAKQITFATT